MGRAAETELASKRPLDLVSTAALHPDLGEEVGRPLSYDRGGWAGTLADVCS